MKIAFQNKKDFKCHHETCEALAKHGRSDPVNKIKILITGFLCRVAPQNDSCE